MADLLISISIGVPTAPCGSVLPANHFPLVEGAPALLFAAGIGVTPILAMAEELSERGVPFDMHYAARLPDNAAFADYLTRSKYAE